MRILNGARCINCGIFTKEGEYLCHKCNAMSPELIAIRFYRKHVMDQPEAKQ